MSKSTHFIGQPVYLQMLNLIDKRKVKEIGDAHEGNRYTKKFFVWDHLVTILYAMIMRFDSLREIETSLLVSSRRLAHLGIQGPPKRSTISYANQHRSEAIFGEIYQYLYDTYRDRLSLDSRNKNLPQWMSKLKIIDSTTISMFSDLLFKGAGRLPKFGNKKGGAKMHTVIHAVEGVPCDVKFTSAATHDSFMLRPATMTKGDIIAMDRAYIDYGKMEEMTQRGVIYVTKMKKNLKYDVTKDLATQNPSGLMVTREQCVIFRKRVPNGKDVEHSARIVTYIDQKGKTSKLVSLLTNDMKSDCEEIVAIYQKRWEIELLFKQIKQNFPLRYFYGNNVNAVKIQIWVVLIANLLLTVMKNSIKREWSFSGMATMLRIVLMSYLNFYELFNQPEKDWKEIISKSHSSPPLQLSLFD